MVEIPAEVKKTLNEYITSLRKEINVKSVILFGSYAQASQRSDSDIDIAVFSRAFAQRERTSSIAYLLDKALPYGLDIQPVAFNEDELDNYEDNPFVNEIVTTGIRIA